MLDDLLQRRPYNAAVDLIDANVARGLGDKIAFMDGERSLTYAGCNPAACGSPPRCKAWGCGRKSASCSFCRHVDYPVAFWGAIRAGIVVIPLNPLLTTSSSATFWPIAALPRSCWRRRSPTAFCPCGIGCRACACSLWRGPVRPTEPPWRPWHAYPR